MSIETLNKIIYSFKTNKLEFKHIKHDIIPRDSLGAAKIRGSNINDAAKALVFQTKSGKFVQAIIPGSLKLDSKKFKKLINEKNISLANPNNIFKLTDCVVGTIPPTGSFWNIPVYIDNKLLERKQIVFSAGTNTDSITTAPQNLIKINNAILADISKEN